MELKGKLFVIGTPIGNLSDITFRALEALKNVTFVLAEDTRHTKKLFSEYDVNTQLVSYRDQNHEKMLPKILEKLDAGLNLGLVSDAGMPLISDPGYKLVEYLKLNGYEVISIPGPDSVASALSVSGLPTDRFTFLGFLPKSDSKRESILQEYMKLDSTLVIFESPNRVKKLLGEVMKIDGKRRVSVANDLTKLYEKVITGKVSSLINEVSDSLKGEFVILVAKEEV